MQQTPPPEVTFPADIPPHIAAQLGSVDRANVYPREVLKRALAHNAAAVIFAHNHPSGVAEPSISDIKLTQELSSLLRQIDVRVLDHIVVGRGREVSMAERGLL